MKAVPALCLLLGIGCATTVRDLPVGEPPPPGQGLIAGRVDFGRLSVRGFADGASLAIEPRHTTFLVALPPGTYAITGFGAYQPKNEQVTFEAVAGQALYIGDFMRAANKEGQLVVAVHDSLDGAIRELRRRYGDDLPIVQAGLVQSNLERPDGTFLIAVYREEPRVHSSFGIAIGGVGVSFR